MSDLDWYSERQTVILETQLRDSVKRVRGSAAMAFFADRSASMPDAMSDKIGLVYTTLGGQDTWTGSLLSGGILRGRKVQPGESYIGKNYGVHGNEGTRL